MKANCMQLSDKKTEVLAPAGNFESLKCAMMNGADAVYLGLTRFNARAKAGNFTTEELKKAVEFCRFFGVKVYVTFNTIYKQSEYDDVITCMKECRDIGVNAFILQDFSLISRIKSTMPDIVLHLSTQAAVHNLEGALAAEKLGFTRVILSREALLGDIEKIHKNTSLEIEAFVQGALCVSFSGNCYFSSLVSGFSGNRGKCMQLCRKQYVFNGKKAYWLSPKDVCMKNKVDQLIKAGVCSFKIEGRMRRPEYVGEAVNCYKTILSGEKYDISRLKRMFNRGNYTEVYIGSDREDIIFPYSQNHIGQYAGTVRSVNGKTATLSCNLSRGDGVKFLHNNIESGSAGIISDGSKTGFSGNIFPGDKVCITTDKQLCDEVLTKKRFVSFDLFAKIENNRAVFALSSGVEHVEITIDNLADAKNSPLSEVDIVSSFSRTEDIGFKLNNVNIAINQAVFIPKSQLNQIRRTCCEQLKKKIIESAIPEKNDKQYKNIFSDLTYFTSPDDCIIARFDNVNTANKTSELYDYAAYSPRDWTKNVADELKSLKKPFLLVLPNVMRGEDAGFIKEVLSSDFVKNVIVNNIYGISLSNNKNVLFGPMMNFITDEIKCAKIMSAEGKNTNPENFVYYYGKFPLMTFCHCPFKSGNDGKCLGCKTPPTGTLKDEYGNSFTLYSYRAKYCYCKMLNDNPINLTGTDIKTQRKVVDLIGFDEQSCYNILESVKTNKKLPGGTLAFYNKKLE